MAQGKFVSYIQALIFAITSNPLNSRQSIKKYISQSHNIDERSLNIHFSANLRKLVEKGELVQPRGTRDFAFSAFLPFHYTRTLLRLCCIVSLVFPT